jgi:hypothetical protein
VLLLGLIAARAEVRLQSAQQLAGASVSPGQPPKSCLPVRSLQVLSSGTPEVCNYPFTTRSIKMGHFYLDGRKHQVPSCAGCHALTLSSGWHQVFTGSLELLCVC